MKTGKELVEAYFHGAHYDQWSSLDLITKLEEEEDLASCVAAIVEEAKDLTDITLDEAEVLTYCTQWLQDIASSVTKYIPEPGNKNAKKIE